ncbi:MULTISPECIES: hypothetical protein [Bacteroides]|jgi:hypothetical protein|uniref:Uncharacterized protein n=2 Tax=Bacteroides xylanisolvens TaxID=371601 RepID=A0A4Q5D823_9BACE|nr:MULTISPECIES: hypothetical protein [Bacteroides]KAB6079912.1 hypothetical protein GA560_18480 [Bacteroides xylanisolvens]KAB6093615.1 hypothetical protein GA562_16670 [Bacteroides xylanisolvens]KAB6094137.1 hypothetical protein GA551_05960 [Bacteroides xylanisolvens]KAB6112295.1 hypothetical protein GA564_11085 [Bacteroides xylanisolvens]KAB6143523.1 hypothetical protein GA398_20360 [Bacteroides xylanisolvens]
MIKSTAEMLKKGYLLFPKVLFEEQIKVTKGATGYFDAFILVLTHVNYSTVECRIHQYTFQCRRGESVMSMVHWAELFGWKRSRTRYFFNKMYDEGIIERLSNPYITHIRIPDYDLLVGQKRRESVRAEADGITFDTFWEKYHDITRKPKTNVGRARREWNKLSVNERCLSLSHIDEYYDNLADIKYCMQAASYLSNKAFMNEYDY